MLLYLSVTGIILSLLLLYFNGGKFRSTIYLGIFFLVLSLYGINQYVLLYSGSVFLVSVIMTNIAFTSYLIGPMLYWYVRSILSDNSSLKKSDLWHLLPMVVYFAAALPYLFSSYSYKVEIAKAVVHDVGFLSTYKFTVLSEIFPNVVVYLSRPVLVLVYTILSVNLFIRYLKRKSNLLVLSGQVFMIKWLSSLIGFTLLLVGSHLISVFQSFINNSDVFFTTNLLQILSAVGLIGLLVSPLFFPDILYGLPRFRVPISRALLVETSEMEPEEEIKPRDPSFETDYMVLIDKKMHSCMQEFKPYLQPELNLTRFSDILHLPTHHLAYFFREVKRQSFNDYCNECRVEYAKTLMQEGKTSDVTLEAVGILSGFNNRSTFFRAFKKFEGISPGSFMASMSQN
ncbi:MAG: helix-turn-helix domain-containing protein [Bacteroidia bacterium]|jgi:AraC-like DNA-binding protein